VLPKFVKLAEVMEMQGRTQEWLNLSQLIVRSPPLSVIGCFAIAYLLRLTVAVTGRRLRPQVSQPLRVSRVKGALHARESAHAPAMWPRHLARLAPQTPRPLPLPPVQSSLHCTLQDHDRLLVLLVGWVLTRCVTQVQVSVLSDGAEGGPGHSRLLLIAKQYQDRGLMTVVASAHHAYCCT
jgi:hypothetical protein